MGRAGDHGEPGDTVTEHVTVLGVGGDRPLSAAGRAALAEAGFVSATRAELAAVRGLVPPDAVVDVLGDTAMDDPEGHRWDLPRQPALVVVLTPPGDLVRRVVRAIGAHLGPQRVRALEPPSGAEGGAGLVVDPEAGPVLQSPRARGWALPGEEWDAPDVLPAAVRAVVLAWLGPGPGDLVWDLGAGGGGAVGVESVRLGAGAVTLVPDLAAGERARRNAARHGVEVTVVQGEDVAALAALPDPDAVFISDGHANLAELLAVAAGRRPRALVAALSSDVDADLARAALEGGGLLVEGAVVAVERLARPGARVPGTVRVTLLRGSAPGG